MTLTLEFPPDLEARLRTNAAIHGKDVGDYLLTLVENDVPIDLTEFRDMEDFEESVAELHAGFADLEAGRTIPFEEVVARGRAEREARRKKREATAQTQPQSEVNR